MEQHIISYIHDLFRDVPKSGKVVEQKEELRIHLEERVNEYMAQGFSFEEAFGTAKNDLGEMDELLRELGKKTKKRKKRKYKRSGGFPYMLTSLSPFIYVLMGVLIGDWRVWVLGWMIIPISGIFETFVTNRSINYLIPLSPFIYIGLGLWIGGTFWAWGWIIIPIAAILFGKVYVDLEKEDDFDIDIDIDMDLPDLELRKKGKKIKNGNGGADEKPVRGFTVDNFDDRSN